MTWLPLESRMLSSVAYDEERQILYLRFRTTGTPIATSNSRSPSIRRSSTPSPGAVSSSLTSAADSATSAWRNSALPDQA